MKIPQISQCNHSVAARMVNHLSYNCRFTPIRFYDFAFLPRKKAGNAAKTSPRAGSWAYPFSMRLLRLAVLAVALIGSAPASAYDWGQFAMISDTLGVNANRLCMGEGLRGDIGCPSYAPYVSNSGYVGIGTSAPSATVHALGAMRLDALGYGGNYNLRFITTASGGYIQSSEAATSGSVSNLYFTGYNGSPVHMTITSTSSVGVGAYLSNPSTTLHVSGTLRISSGGEACDANRAGGIRYNSGTFEFCAGSAWQSLAAVAGAGLSLDDLNDAATDYSVSYTLFVGQNAGVSSTGGPHVTGIGRSAAYLNKGSYVTGIGSSAAYANSGTALTVMWYAAGYQNTGSNVSAMGYNAARDNTGAYVTAIGSLAGYQNNSASYVTAVGSSAAYANSGTLLTSVGHAAGYQNTGSSVSAFGFAAGYQNTGTHLSAMGYYAARENTGAYTTAIGSLAGYQNTGSNVVAIGYEAGRANATANQFILKQNNINTTPLIQGDFATGKVGIATTTPSSSLHVAAGEVQVANSGAACSADNAGAVRYDNTNKKFFVCRGTP